MTDNRIKELAYKFREAIASAKKYNAFGLESKFYDFPNGCCGEASHLLAEYFSKYGIETLWVSNDRDGWSHAWLVIKDRRVNKPSNYQVEFPKELKGTLTAYGMKNMKVSNTNYEEKDLRKGLIVDITCSQFNDCEDLVYVGKMDKFHSTFKFISAKDYKGLDTAESCRLYKVIEKWL